MASGLPSIAAMESNVAPILVLAPHPDDESLGCGGTITLLTQAGAAVDVLYLTRGEFGLEAPEASTPEARQHLAETRMREAHAACCILGVRQVDFLDGADGRLAESPHLAADLHGRLKEGEYGRVFCPWPHDRHPDHQATFRLLQRALRNDNAPLHVWLYEVWTPLLPTICVPIDSTMVIKVEAIRAHKSQLACLDYLSAFQGLAAYRSLACPGTRYAEAFQTGDRAMVLETP